MNKIKTLLYEAIRRFDDLVYTYFGPSRVLLVVRNKTGLSCLLPMIVALEKKGSAVKIVITVEFDGCVEMPKSGHSKRVLDQYFMPNRKAVWRKWHFIITTDICNLHFRRHHTMITSSHGCGFGTGDKHKDGNIDYHVKRGISPDIHICFENSINSYRAFLSQAPLMKDHPEKFYFVTGFAKSDELFDSQGTKREDFFSTVGLSDNHKNIVIFSHWSEKSLLRNCGLALIRELIHLGDNFNIIINGHEKLWFDPIVKTGAPTSLREEIKDLENSNNNIKHVIIQDDLTGLLASADLFITDYSGSFIECCLVDKPILFYKHPEFSFSSQEVGRLYCNASWMLQKEEDVADLCRLALSKPNEHKLERKQVVDYFLNRQGSSADYVADILLKMGRVCGPTSVGWSKVRELNHIEMTPFSDKSGFQYE